MEFGKVSLIFFAVVVGVAYGCDMAKVQGCMTKFTQSGNPMEALSKGVDGLKKFCKIGEDAVACVKRESEGCDATITQGVLAGFKSLQHMCDKDAPCTGMKAVECGKDLPMSEPDNYEDACKNVPKAVACMKKLTDACKDQPDDVMTMIGGLKQGVNAWDKNCKKMYGNDYAEKMKQKGGDDGDDDDGNGASQVAGFSVLLLVSAVLARLGL